MKKIVFTLQALAIVTMLPLYFIVELNRGTVQPPSGNTSSFNNQMQEKKFPKATANLPSEFKNQYTITEN